VFTAVVASEDGEEVIKETITSPADTVREKGRELAVKLLENGGKRILENLNSNE